jgi:hypothetical protein
MAVFPFIMVLSGLFVVGDPHRHFADVDRGVARMLLVSWRFQGGGKQIAVSNR